MLKNEITGEKIRKDTVNRYIKEINGRGYKSRIE